MPKPEKKYPYLEFIVEQFAPLGEITVRPMFGGHTLYCGGIPFALIANSAVFLKADDHNRPRFEALGLKPFKPFEDQPGVMQYYPPPASIFEDPDELRVWVGGAIEAGRRAQAKKSKAKKRSR